MNHATVSLRISRTLFALAAAVSALAFVNGGVDRGLAACLGAGLSLANWFALRWLGARIMQGQGALRALVSMLLVGKIGLLVAIVFVLVNTLGLDPIGLCLGLSVLFFGPVLGALLAGSAESTKPSAATAAHEER